MTTFVIGPKNEISSGPALLQLQQEWLSAKKAEDGWNAHRKGIEDKIKQILAAGGVDLTVAGTVRLEEVELKASTERSWEQLHLAALIGANPHMLGTTFKAEYTPAVSKQAIDAMVKNGGELGAQVRASFTDKLRGPYFSKRG